MCTYLLNADMSSAVTSMISRTSQCFSRPSSFSWAVPTTLSDLKRPLWAQSEEKHRESTDMNYSIIHLDEGTYLHVLSQSCCVVVCLFFLPLVDDFKFETFGLDDAPEATVVAVDVELELLFKLRTAGAFYCAGFVSLSLLLHTDMQTRMHQRTFTYKLRNLQICAQQEWKAYFTHALSPRTLLEVTEKGCVCEHKCRHIFPPGLYPASPLKSSQGKLSSRRHRFCSHLF